MCLCVPLMKGNLAQSRVPFIAFTVFAWRWFEYSTSLYFSFRFRLIGHDTERAFKDIFPILYLNGSDQLNFISQV